MKAYMDDHSKPDSWIYSSMVMSYSSTANVLGAQGILNVMVEVGFKQQWPPPMEFECLDCAIASDNLAIMVNGLMQAAFQTTGNIRCDCHVGPQPRDNVFFLLLPPLHATANFLSNLSTCYPSLEAWVTLTVIYPFPFHQTLNTLGCSSARLRWKITRDRNWEQSRKEALSKKPYNHVGARVQGREFLHAQLITHATTSTTTTRAFLAAKLSFHFSMLLSRSLSSSCFVGGGRRETSKKKKLTKSWRAACLEFSMGNGKRGGLRVQAKKKTL